MKRKRTGEGGYILITVYLLIAALLGLLATYYQLSHSELSTTRFSKDSTTGFYSAEAGLNLRAEAIRDIFVGYNRPSGASPSSTDPCTTGNMGTGDFACQTYNMNNREVVTYVEEDPANPVILTIPPGERYQNLNAQEYRYTVRSISRNIHGKTEAILELRFKSRLVPLFQFVAFYNKDLEILPGPVMNLSGPIHTNGDLYMNANNELNIDGQVTTAGDLYRGRKNTSECFSNPVTVVDPLNPLALIPSCSSRTLVDPGNLDPWNGMIESEVETVTVPEPESLDPTPGEIYWDSADIRLQLRLNGSENPITHATNSPTGVWLVASDGSTMDSESAALHGCSGNISGRPVGTTATFYNNREGTTIRMVEIDMVGLLDCLHTTNWFGTSKILGDTTDGGLVFHFSIDGPSSGAPSNNYGIRVRNAATLQSSIAGAPGVLGMTLVTDQAFYTHGDYNANNWIPAAILADSLNVLSNNWNLNDNASTQSLSNRNASDTTVNAAFLSGTDSTGGLEGAGGQGGNYNGGLENYPRFHESWSGDDLNYLGAFVSLNAPRHVTGAWQYGNPQYQAPNRNWDYDTRFNSAQNLPPLSPRFVYLRQELFVREFEQ